MSGWVKYLIIPLLFVALMVFVVTLSIRHQTNITGTQEVMTGLQSVNVGEVRNSTNEEFINQMDKKSVVSNLILNIVKAHNEQGKNVKVSYVFFDENDSITTNDDDITSVQFEVQLLGKDDQVESTSTQRIQLDSKGGN